MATENVNKLLTFDSLENLVKRAEIPEGWVPQESEITYGVLEDLFAVVEKISYSSSHILTALNLLSGRDLSDLIKHVPNFVKKMKNFIKKNPGSVGKVVPDLSANTASTNVNFLGPFCEKLGVNKTIIQDIGTERSGSCSAILPSLPNGVILELENYRATNKYSWSTYVNWTLTLMGEIDENCSPPSAYATEKLIKNV